jgi:dolichyl-phosphate beta-glucosyltransferase
MEKTAISVVIPAYNEEDRIPSTIERVWEYLEGRSGGFEILVVDDGSDDGTGAVVREMGERLRNIRLLVNERNMGKGYSIRKGMLSARGELMLISDADLSTPIEEVERLMPFTGEGFDIAIGSRGLKDSRLEVRQPWHREGMGRIFNLIVRLLLIGGIRDTQCGFKLFRAEAAREVFGRAVVNGFSFDVEVLFIAVKLGYRIKEVPIKWLNSPASRVSVLRDPLRMFLDLLAIKANWRRGVYSR